MRDDANPRSLAFQAKGLAEYMDRLEERARRASRRRRCGRGTRRCERCVPERPGNPRARALARTDRPAAARRASDVGRDLAASSSRTPSSRSMLRFAASGPGAAHRRRWDAACERATPVEHATRYTYRIRSSQSWQLAHLTPRALPWQQSARARADDRAARPTSGTRRATPSATASSHFAHARPAPVVARAERRCVGRGRAIARYAGRRARRPGSGARRAARGQRAGRPAAGAPERAHALVPMV